MPVVQAPPKPAPVQHAPPRHAPPRTKPRVVPKQAVPKVAQPSKAPPLPTLAPPPPLAAPTPTPVAAPPAVPAAVRMSAIGRYAATVRGLIQAQVRVPQTVRALRLRGRALVAFRLAPDGHLLWARLVRSSGLGPIDRAALREVRERQYPHFSSKMPHHPLNFSVVVDMNAAHS